VSTWNLSAWGLLHRPLVYFFMLVLSTAGAFAYARLGRAEDPSFKIKAMVVIVDWPGASAREVEEHITDTIERTLQEVPHFDYASSYSKPGESVITINLRDDTPPGEVAECWYQVRKRLGDARGNLPAGAVGPFFNDDFGDTFGNLYAFHSDGFSPREMKDILLDVRQRLLRVPDVAKVNLVGVQDEVIYVEFSHARLAKLGIPESSLFAGLATQNAMQDAGAIEGSSDRVYVRVDGATGSLEKVRDVPIHVGTRIFRIGDVADVHRGPVDPASFSMRHRGEQVEGVAVSMVEGGNILELGKHLDETMVELRATLPAGISVERISDQPAIVDDAIHEFVRSLGEAVLIVLVVSFISLGLRSGVVVAIAVPLVLGITFAVMWTMGIDLHRISLGALIIALGLLVDDAIIAVEMVQVKLEEGWDRVRAASFAWNATAFPMLTGTLVTAAGFIPIGFARGSASEYTGAIFWVVTVALLSSWVAAVLFVPLLSVKLLPTPRHGADHREGALLAGLRHAIESAVAHRRWVIVATVACFALSILAFSRVQQQFFPDSDRVEVVVDLELEEGATYAATKAQVERLEKVLKNDATVTDFVSYVGGSSPRFFLSLAPEVPRTNYAQVIAKTASARASTALATRLRDTLHADFSTLRARVSRLPNGPAVGYPVQFRVLGTDPEQVRSIAGRVRDIVRENPHARDVNLQWSERTKDVRLVMDHARARELGVTDSDVASALGALLVGVPVTQVREGHELIQVVARGVPAERLSTSTLDEVHVPSASGASIPLGQVAHLSYEQEDGILWHRSRDVSLAVRADVDGVQASVVTAQLEQALAPLVARLPPGYRLETGGETEESLKAQKSIYATMPLMVLVTVTLLMLQLQSFSRLAIVLLTAPLGIIGVVLGLLAFQAPFGFVAQLGATALAGMIMRNSVILVMQIENDVASGSPLWTAIVDATVRRARPILLTAAAAILAMIPLSRSPFWGPMAIAIMGGLLVATVLTLFFVPALYAAWFRAKPVAQVGERRGLQPTEGLGVRGDVPAAQGAE
jgi:multidrug efflux pump